MSNHPFNQTLFSIAAFVTMMISLGQSAPTAVERHGQLRVAGNRIVDRHGEPFVLRGMSLFWSQWMGQYYNSNVVRRLRDDWGCTVVRAAMGVEMGGYLANPEREQEKVESVVQAAIDLGVYVIVDWHDHHADQHVAEARKFFAIMAQKYGRHPNVLFETWNEPLKTHDWTKVIKPYHEALIPAIREHAPISLILCGTSSWSQDVDVAALDPLKFENIAYTLHFYAATHKQRLREKAATALAGGVALFVTEWGTSEATGGGKLDEAEATAWLEFLEKNHVSWCNWSIADKRETSAALQPGAKATAAWTAEALSPSGIFVREKLRAMSMGTRPSP